MFLTSPEMRSFRSHRAVSALFFLCCASRLAFAVEVVSRPLDAFPEAPTFAGGKDVFGRSPRCRTCHAVLNSLNARLVPALMKIRSKEERRQAGGGADSRAVRYGVYEEAIEAYVQGACSTQDLWHAKETRKQCEAMMEDHEDDIASAYSRWLKKGAPAEEDGWSWNWEVCLKATESCGEELAMHALAEFDDDGSGAAERRYRSEPAPEPGETRDGLAPVTAGTFFDAVVAPDHVDVLVYFAYPNGKDEATKFGDAFHRRIVPALRTAQAMFDADPKYPRGGFKTVVVDAELNDVPPPYSFGGKTPTLCLYPAGNKGWPRYISDTDEGRMTPHDVLFFVMNTASAPAAEKARQLMTETDRETLYRKPWEREEEEL